MTQLSTTVVISILSSVSVFIIEIGKSGLHLSFEEFFFKDEKKEMYDGVCVCVYVLLPGKGVQGDQPRRCFLGGY